MGIVSHPSKKGWVVVSCDGGCGRSVELRRRKVRKAEFFTCDSKADGVACKNALPPRSPNQGVRFEFNAAASFTGYWYEDMDEETATRVEHAKRILAAGVSKKAIDDARSRPQ